MPRIPKRLLALGGLTGAGVVTFLRRRRAARPAAPAPSAEPLVPPAAAGSEPIAATPPVESPGPSVTPPGRDRGSTTERAEAAAALVPETDDLVDAETAAAAVEAGAIGGPRTHDAPDDDPAFEAVYEGGGGESEGFELAEADLIENASHGGGGGDPLRDALRGELEADEATGIAGEADGETVADAAEEDR